MSDFDPFGPLPGTATTTVLEASAGTGKTWTIAALATRYVAEQGLELSQLMLVTFGRAATQELRERTRARLTSAALGLADEVVVLDVYGAREDPEPGVSGALIAEHVPLPPDRVRFVPRWAEVPAVVADVGITARTTTGNGSETAPPSRRARHSAASATAVENCVPLMSARPSLGPRTRGDRPAARSASAPATPSRVSPSPIITASSGFRPTASAATSSRCDSGLPIEIAVTPLATSIAATIEPAPGRTARSVG